MLQETSKRIAANIGAQLQYDDEKIAVVAYGLLAIMQVTLILVYSLLFGLVTGTLLPALIINFSVGILRSFTGGAHSDTMAGCVIMSCIVISSGALCSVYLLPAVPALPAAILFVLIFAGLFFIAHRNVPVDSPNKPIRKPEKVKRLRRQSFTLLSLFSGACAVFLIVFFLTENRGVYALFWALFIGTLWQVWTLTAPGRKLLKGIDAVFQRQAAPN